MPDAWFMRISKYRLQWTSRKTLFLNRVSSEQGEGWLLFTTKTLQDQVIKYSRMTRYGTRELRV